MLLLEHHSAWCRLLLHSRPGHPFVALFADFVTVSGLSSPLTLRTREDICACMFSVIHIRQSIPRRSSCIALFMECDAKHTSKQGLVCSPQGCPAGRLSKRVQQRNLPRHPSKPPVMCWLEATRHGTFPNYSCITSLEILEQGLHVHCTLHAEEAKA